MDAAVVEFYSLADSVWSSAQDYYLSSIGRICFAFGFECGIEVWCGCLEFRAAGIYGFVDGVYILLLSAFADVEFFDSPNLGEAFVAEAVFLGLSHHFGGYGFAGSLFQRFFELDYVVDIIDEPGVDFGQFEEFLD